MSSSNIKYGSGSIKKINIVSSEENHSNYASARSSPVPTRFSVVEEPSNVSDIIPSIIAKTVVDREDIDYRDMGVEITSFAHPAKSHEYEQTVQYSQNDLTILSTSTVTEIPSIIVDKGEVTNFIANVVEEDEEVDYARLRQLLLENQEKKTNDASSILGNLAEPSVPIRNLSIMTTNETIEKEIEEYIETVEKDIEIVETVEDNMGNVETVENNIESVETVEDNIGNVETVENNIENVETVEDNIGNVETVENERESEREKEIEIEPTNQQLKLDLISQELDQIREENEQLKFRSDNLRNEVDLLQKENENLKNNSNNFLQVLNQLREENNETNDTLQELEQLREENKLLKLKIDDQSDSKSRELELMHEENERLKLDLHAYKKHTRPLSKSPESTKESKKIETRRNIFRDKLYFKLQLTKVDELEADTLSELVKEIMLILKIDDVNRVVPSLEQINKVMRLVPQLRDFIKTVILIVLDENEIHQDFSSRVLPQDIPPENMLKATIEVLAQWRETVNNVEEFAAQLLHNSRRSTQQDIS